MKFGAATRPKAVRAERAASNRRLLLTFLLGALAGALIVTFSPLRTRQGVLAPKGGLVPQLAPPAGNGQSAATSEGEAAAGGRQRTKLLAFVGVNTGYGSAGRRKVLRETWFPSTPELLSQAFDSSGLMFKFVIGRTTDEKKEAALQEEIRQYDDFLRLDVAEGYGDLNKKTLVYFRTAYKLYDAVFYVKADDDIYLRPDRLGLLLARERSSPRVYIGCLKHGNVITDKRYKWFEPQGQLLGKEYFLHAYGPIYALSQEVVQVITSIKDGTLRMFMNEDVTVGSWMLALDVTHEHTLDLCSAKCTNTHIAIFDLPECSGLCKPLEKMPLLHKDPLCSGTASSGSS